MYVITLFLIFVNQTKITYFPLVVSYQEKSLYNETETRHLSAIECQILIYLNYFLPGLKYYKKAFLQLFLN